MQTQGTLPDLDNIVTDDFDNYKIFKSKIPPCTASQVIYFDNKF